MQKIYQVNPVECQPTWDSPPEPISYPWGKGFLAASALAFAFVITIDILYAAYLLGAAL